ncbi:hypothetical protein COLO4_08220 [Corchorus olitorius]|uniref:PB1-like domain-containing protein n=1 Tax=Corchorus olitorius TaxID=93759 RepID=A0A1R3KGU2_9ROSI|nr:hypothetical protein COLO4_08220 [Corchorus olitorius]
MKGGLNGVFEDNGYKNVQNIYYLRPSFRLKKGLKRVFSDDSAMDMISDALSRNFVEIFIEHSVQEGLEIYLDLPPPENNGNDEGNDEGHDEVGEGEVNDLAEDIGEAVSIEEEVVVEEEVDKHVEVQIKFNVGEGFGGEAVAGTSNVRDKAGPSNVGDEAGYFNGSTGADEGNGEDNQQRPENQDGSTTLVIVHQPDGEGNYNLVVDRFYVCFAALSKGPKAPRGQLPIQPPPFGSVSGRPKTARRKKPYEPNKDKDDSHLSRKGQIQTYGTCQQKGHNKRSCKAEIMEGTAPEMTRQLRSTLTVQQARNDARGEYVQASASGSFLFNASISAQAKPSKPKSRPLPKILTMPPRIGDCSWIDAAGNHHGLKRGRSSPASIAKLKKATIGQDRVTNKSRQPPVGRSPRNLQKGTGSEVIAGQDSQGASSTAMKGKGKKMMF